MIWTRGHILPRSDFRIQPQDRVFEHGLGLFETFRTWSGRAVWLTRHLARIDQSARMLGIPFNPQDLPAESHISALIQASAITGDARLRLTMTGGTTDGEPAMIWLEAGPLPPAPREGGFVIGPDVLHVTADDPLSRHKTLNYWNRRIAFEKAVKSGADESLVCTPDGRVWESTRMNLWLIRQGAICTPPLTGPVLPGITRAVVLQLARELGCEVREAEIQRSELHRADELFLTNSVRGIVPVSRLPECRLDAPGPITRRLIAALRDQLQHGAQAS
jgi:branched-subunit amino acid aminotransferase/4-amino-4-deoxychorismate lyase